MKDVDRYRSGLMEIKRRMRVIDQIGKGELNIIYPATSVETAALQFRKVVELIAFSSLIAHKELYSETYEKFATHWNARLILQDLERINPNFYPEPILQVPSKREGIMHDLVERPNDYLTKAQLISLYEECGGLMHAENPYGKKIDYDAFAAKTKNWRNRIVNLLNTHVVRLVDENQFWLFQMGTDKIPPSYTLFGRVVDDKEAPATL